MNSKIHHRSRKIPTCGFIIHNLKTDQLLLVQEANGKWSYPKGGMEKTDTSTLKCAIRELKEETGINIGIYRDIPLTLHKKIVRESEYYMYKLNLNINNDEVVVKPTNPAEIINYRWFNRSDITLNKDMFNFVVRSYQSIIK